MSEGRGESPPHGTAIAIDGRGVLITGRAGAGKTVLALETIRRARGAGLRAGLIADDRTILSAERQGVRLSCPEPIAGRVEVRGWGVVDAAPILAPPARLVLLVRLVPAAEALRLATGHRESVEGQAVACLRLPEGPPPGAPMALLAALGLPAWL